ncbi:hypothetical protein LH128_22569 [Sphingomonas sp. LH128]|uniref:hypothetical protein n=1 Tax=Sphingomonas sp. LH128 TaxID=473781 RepID=UPI00027CA3DE|nr:hypothetical protein [Sphingomonas sp. LH128]EJU10703.1 hypothetical protein LH128_22569 [Sphingomonas sp. LH128]
MIAATFLSLLLVAAGFHAIRRAKSQDRAHAWRTGGAILLALACAASIAGAETALIGAMLWLFCVLPLAALPEIFGRRNGR